MNGADRAAWRVPGRIEVLGKHTDYAGGRVLVGAVDRGVSAVAERVEGTPGSLAATTTVGGEPVTLMAGRAPDLGAGHWGNYLQTVLDRLTSNFGTSVPAKLTITSDLPAASGMSSSSALICATALALSDLNGWTRDPAWRHSMPDRLSLAGYLAAVEAGRPWHDLRGIEGVGTQGGSEDHTGMLCGAPGELLAARFDPMSITEHVPFPEQWSIVVGVSGVLAEKTGAALRDYNRGPATLRRILRRWNEMTGRSDSFIAGAVRSLVGDIIGEAVLREPALGELLGLAEDDYERGRLEQFLTESLMLVPAGAAAIRSADPVIGEILEHSHALAHRKLGNQVPLTNAMVGLARQMGAIGASAFGAGWGGSVYALVPRSDAEAFAAAWLAEYQRLDRAPQSATTLVTRPGEAARRV